MTKGIASQRRATFELLTTKEKAVLDIFAKAKNLGSLG
jgi:hypothetical protein